MEMGRRVCGRGAQTGVSVAAMPSKGVELRAMGRLSLDTDWFSRTLGTRSVIPVGSGRRSISPSSAGQMQSSSKDRSAKDWERGVR